MNGFTLRGENHVNRSYNPHVEWELYISVNVQTKIRKMYGIIKTFKLNSFICTNVTNYI